MYLRAYQEALQPFSNDFNTPSSSLACPMLTLIMAIRTKTSRMIRWFTFVFCLADVKMRRNKPGNGTVGDWSVWLGGHCPVWLEEDSGGGRGCDACWREAEDEMILDVVAIGADNGRLQVELKTGNMATTFCRAAMEFKMGLCNKPNSGTR
jgi:hypothetical protein